jgi:DNA-binding MarR family transcriptional regulator
MAMVMLKDVPQYECLLERSKRFPDLDPSAVEAFLHLLRTSTDVYEAFSRLMERNNISPGRFTVLMLLFRNTDKPANPADLADRSGVTRATMTGLVDTLERDGLVKREPDPTDRRMMLVGLTAKGREFIEKILPDYYRRVSALMAHTTQTDRKTLVALMAKVQQGIPAVGA